MSINDQSRSVRWVSSAVLACAVFARVGVASAAPVAVAHHPLDPLTAEELTTARELISKHKEFPLGALFPMIALNEPSKAEVNGALSGANGGGTKGALHREAFATVYDRTVNATFEAVVDLSARKVRSFKKRLGVQPLVLVSEYDWLPKIVKADPRWQAAMQKRGITDFEKVAVDTWAAGGLVSKKYPATRVLRAVSYLKDGAVNFYGRPIEGVIATVDMNHEKVLEVIDTGVKPIAKVTQELDAASVGPQRKDLKPLKIETPEGPSFTVSGHEVRWQKWRFRFALHPREGLILYQVAYEDGGRERSILYRASLSETVVPYGDPDPNWSWRAAFDEGEYGMGRLMSPLDPKVDAPENAVFFDADFSDDFGKPYVLKNAVGMYERDGGYLWKHYDFFSGKNEARRARDLVIYSVAVIGNYDYVFSWIFHQDGSIDCDVGLTGIMLPKGVKETTVAGHEHGAESKGVLGTKVLVMEKPAKSAKAAPTASAPSSAHGHLVAKNVVAPHHQHFLNYRLDFDIEGDKNSVSEMTSQAMPAGSANPVGNGIEMKLTQLKSEKVAQRDMDFATSRRWVVYNPSLKSDLGYPPGYAVLPGDNSVPYIAKNSSARVRGSFINHHFWTTRFHPEEIYAGGFYPNQSKGDDGLQKWASNGESLDAEDLVAWYTFGVTHIPRPEEWPVMAMTHAGFRIVPVAFFTRNPGLDVK